MKEDYIIGSGNVFKDLGFENPEEELAKARLASFLMGWNRAFSIRMRMAIWFEKRLTWMENSS